eukprot:GILI01026368.1.p1 GENE.GILI01026368.1~~GILI01026368.1.p1  ORF type:complete len:339 (+),score=61.36 GILI01026368.1:63-1079(+)
MNETQRHLAHSTRGAREETDKQVAKIRNDPRLLSLCDVVTEELLAGRHPERPILTRLAIVGEIATRTEPVRNVIESVVGIVTKRVNSEDPAGGLVRTTVVQQSPAKEEGAPPVSTTTVQTSFMSISGVCVEFATRFIAVFESEPLHLVELVKELRGRLAKPNVEAKTAPKGKNSSVDTAHAPAPTVSSSHSNATAGGASSPPSTSFNNLHIIYQVDDIATRGTALWTHLDATSVTESKAAAAGAAATPLNDQVVKAVHNMLALGAHSQTLSSKAMREQFSTGAATTHAKLFPPQSIVEACIKSDLCLTLAEYLKIFAMLPTVDRDKELLNPLEPALQY